MLGVQAYLHLLSHLHKGTGGVESPCPAGVQVRPIVVVQDFDIIHTVCLQCIREANCNAQACLYREIIMYIECNVGSSPIQALLCLTGRSDHVWLKISFYLTAPNTIDVYTVFLIGGIKPSPVDL